MAAHMGVFKVTRSDRPEYDEYTGFIVVAASEDEARYTHPDPEDFKWSALLGGWVSNYDGPFDELHPCHYWVSDPNTLEVVQVAAQAFLEHEGIVLASFNAG